jgi:hypothetical protein
MAASILAVREPESVWVTIEPGTRHPTVTAARAIDSQRHVIATSPAYPDVPLKARGLAAPRPILTPLARMREVPVFH